ncbi:MAG: tripartite tricarboxylate transporter permease [Yoonia sp.]|uniref:tripartite tricarboxylate transporter permease n=1 Tax=Yoonia sp. TaxID=2212373 RepID=UPI003EF31EB1
MENVILAVMQLADPYRAGMLLLGVCIGLTIGVIPGLGGVFGLTLLVPLTYSLDPVTAVALLVGMAAVTTTSDTIPAVLLGVPGTVGSAATVIDGHPMAENGKAAEALGAAYTASLIGGLFGAAILALSIPVMRPLVLLLNTGDLLGITIFGLTLVAVLSGGSQLKGLIAALLGIMVSLIGLDPYEGSERWTFGSLYFWEGVPTAIVFLGLFGLSELASLAGKPAISTAMPLPGRRGMFEGARSALRHWRLVLRTGGIGAVLGAVPGIGVTVIEWIAYGAAARNKGDGPAFGEGNIRGVIGPESANNSKEGGALIPTLAFGIPGSATMAILLGAFAIHGLSPGPGMLDEHQPTMIVMIISLALANVIGACICLGLTPTLARLASVPAGIVVPTTLVFVVLGAFQSHKEVLDLVVLFLFGLIGISFRLSGWSRPAFALGFVLGPNLERFFVLTYQISGWSWLGQPFVLILFALIFAAGIRQLSGWRKGRTSVETGKTPRRKDDLWLVGLIAVAVGGLVLWSLSLPFAAALLPQIVGGTTLVLACVLFGASLGSGGRWVPVNGLEWFSMRQPEIRFLLMFAVLSLLILATGHVIGPAVFVLGALLTSRALHLWGAALISLATAAISFALFNLLVPQTWPSPWLSIW